MSVSKSYRAAHGTVKDTATGKKTKYPIGDKRHAIAAIAYEDRAKPPLTSGQRHSVEARAAKFGVGPLAKKNKTKKSK